jgi:hypothetical protein
VFHDQLFILWNEKIANQLWPLNASSITEFKDAVSSNDWPVVCSFTGDLLLNCNTRQLQKRTAQACAGSSKAQFPVSQQVDMASPT